jgi:hypothetical protein
MLQYGDGDHNGPQPAKLYWQEPAGPLRMRISRLSRQGYAGTNIASSAWMDTQRMDTQFLSHERSAAASKQTRGRQGNLYRADVPADSWNQAQHDAMLVTTLATTTRRPSKGSKQVDVISLNTESKRRFAQAQAIPDRKADDKVMYGWTSGHAVNVSPES